MTFCPRDGARLQADTALPAGRLIYGRYEIESLIAETHIGQLYRAHDTRNDRRVALEMFNPELSRGDAERLRRFRRDLRDLRFFGHPNIPNSHHITDDFMVMDYLEGQTLDREFRQRGRFTPREVVELLDPVADALDATRAHDIDCEFLTPADILMVRLTKDKPPTAVLLPSIFTRRLIESEAGGAANLTGVRTEAFVAAPYVAPELLHHAAQSPAAAARAQVYSLAVISYELLSGVKPDHSLTASASAPEQAAGQFGLLAELAPDVPAAVARVVERGLSQVAGERPATAGEFVSELQDALGIKKPEKPTTENLSPRRSASRVAADMGSGGDRVAAKPAIRAAPRSSPAATAASANKPLYADENVQFTVYQPEAIAPARWHTLLAFAHLSKRRPDAPPDEPEPLTEVKRIAARVLADEAAEYDAFKQNSLHAVPREGEIRFVPEVAGCEFNPPSQSFLWQKSVHKVEFELRAGVALDGQVARGRLTVFLGTLILADVPLAIRVDGTTTAGVGANEVVPAVPASAAPYRKIFPSYSHKDRAVVEQIEHHVHALGDKYLRDVTELRAGQDWQRWMRDAIREADVFQLFWSHNSMRSAYVRQEWEYALSLGRQNFVRPTYWEEPLPESPTENLPPAELRQLHFQHLRADTIAYQPTSAVAHDEQASSEFYKRAATKWNSHPATEAASAQPTGADVACVNCGERNAPEKAFCQTCGAPLSATRWSDDEVGAAQSSCAQPAETQAQEVSSALDIFWEKRPREAAQNSPPPPSPSYSPMPASRRATRRRSPRRLMLLLLVALTLALAAGVYLLTRSP
jgi:serine/threonine protein kinase